jgi:hypothetical protein
MSEVTMKKTIRILLITGTCVVAMCHFLVARQALTDKQLLQIEENLAVALKSDCPGMRTCAALTLRQVKERVPEYDFDALVFPLMRIVNDEGNDSRSRIAAALALHDIRSAKGDLLIAQVGRFSADPRVRYIAHSLSRVRQQELAERQ